VPIGRSMMLFFMTGLVPYFLYAKQAFYITGAIASNKALLNLPPVKPFDVIASRAILETATELFVGFLLFAGMVVAGIQQAIPTNPLDLTAAIAVAATLGFGIGMINAVIQLYLPSWTILFTLFTGPLYLVSGGCFIAEQVPRPMRDYLLYNQLYTMIAWF